MKAVDIIKEKPIYEHDDSLFESFRHKKVWVTGICGSIGWELAKTLLRYGADVSGIDCNEARVASLVTNHPKLWNKMVPGFYQDILPVGYDFVFHCAAFKHVRLASMNKGGYENNNHRDVHKMVEKMYVTDSKDHRETSFVLCSTDKASGKSIMGVSKRKAENHVVFYGQRALRLVNVAFSKGSCLDLWRKKCAHRVCRGDVQRYWMQMDDAVYALCMAALQPPGRYTVHNCPEFTMEQMARGWDKEYGDKHWTEFELHDEALREEYVDENEKMVPINDVIARIE